MAAQKYRVTAPYVTLKLKDAAGAEVITGFYEGQVAENVDEESAKHHLDDGMIEKVTVDKDGTVVAEKAPASKSAEKPADKPADK